MLRELLAAGIERVEGIGAVGSVFEKVFFGLGLLLHRLVLAEAFALELMDYHPMEVLVVHGKVRAKGCGIIVVDDRLVWVWSVIGAEVGDERRDFQFRYAPVTVGSGRQVCAPQSPGQMNSSSTPPVWLILPSTLTHFS